MELNKTSCDMLAFLREQSDFVTIGQLAEISGLSQRAVRYNLEKIEQYLQKKQFGFLERERGEGVRLPFSQALWEHISGLHEALGRFQYHYAASERVTFILSELLWRAGPVLIEYFCSRLECSRNSIGKDLDEAEQWFAERGISLVKRPKVGLSIKCDEQKRRAALSEVVFNAVESQDVLRYPAKADPGSRLGGLLLASLLSPEEGALAKETIRRLEKALERHLSDQAFGNLIIHLGLMLRRVAEGGHILLPVPPESEVLASPEYAAVQEIFGALAQQKGITLPEDEIAYFTCHLLGAKTITPPDSTQELSGADLRLWQVVEQMADGMAALYDVDFGPVRQALVSGLFVHLKPTIYRIRYGFHIKNPIYSDILRDYQSLFLNTRIVSQVLSDYCGCGISDHEVAYLALHFGAALYRLHKRTKDKARVLLVCGTGLGSAMMMTSQLDKVFLVEVAGVVSSRAVAEQDLRHVDYIISTVPIAQLPPESYIRVNPIFTPKDEEELGRYLSVRPLPKERYDREVEMANRLVAIVDKYGGMANKNQLQYEFLSELMGGENRGYQPRRKYRLSDVLTRDLIVVGQRCDDWQQAVRAGSAILEARGYVTPNYPEAIIASMKEYGPYMVMLPGILVAHARPEDGVQKLAMSLLTLRHPVRFGHKTHDPVQIVVTLAAVDEEKHLKALAQLFQILKKPEHVTAIVDSSTKEDIINLFIANEGD